MSDRMRKIGLSVGAALIAAGTVSGVFAATQNQNTSEPQGSFSGGRRSGPPMGLFGPGGPMGPLGMLGPAVERLGLGDTQKDQLKAILQAHSAEFKALRQQAATAHKALEDAILLDPVSDAAVQSASAGVATVEAQIAVTTAHVRAEVFQILTDAQKAQVKQMIAARDERLAKGRGK
jgi:Spy/CpxP family protein refolding chaperone